MAKIMRFKRESVHDGPPFSTKVITEDSYHYYFYNMSGSYERIEKHYEGSKFNIISRYENATNNNNNNIGIDF